MSPHPRLSGPRTGVLARLLAGAGALLALVAAMVVGFLALMVTLGVMVLGILAVMLRLWWLRRQWRNRHGGDSANPDAGDGRRTIIDGEYTVVQRRRH